MVLSYILKKMNIHFEIFHEVEFETLGITASVVNKKICTFLDNEKYIGDLPENSVMVITTKELSYKIEGKGICIVENPRVLFFELHNFLKDNEKYCRKTFRTQIGQNCNISKLSSISENSVVIGNNVTIEEFVVIRENVTIGDNSVIRAGAIIGGEGYEFKRSGDTINSVKHLGGVLIGKNVEIQYNSCVDKAIYPWDDTIIGDNCKVDNLVHIAHAVKIEKNVMVVALSGIGGRTEIGQDTWIGFSSTLCNGIKVGRSSKVNMGAVVTKSVEDNGNVSGNFAIDHKKFINFIKSIK